MFPYQDSVFKTTFQAYICISYTIMIDIFSYNLQFSEIFYQKMKFFSALNILCSNSSFSCVFI